MLGVNHITNGINKYANVIIVSEPGAIAFVTDFIGSVEGICYIPARYSDAVPPKKHHYCIFYSYDVNLKSLAKSIIEENMNANFILGSSYHNSLCKEILSLSRFYKVKTIFIIDHYSNLHQRFYISETEFVLPNLFVVIDINVSKELQSFYNVDKNHIFIMGHPKLRWEPIFSKQIAQYNSKRDRVLFISEEIKKDKKYYSELPFDEHDVFDSLVKISEDLKFTLDVKLHPLESSKKYQNLKNENKISKKNIVKFINEYDFVIGINSMLLNEIHVYSDRVIFYQPMDQELDCLRNKSDIIITRNFMDLVFQLKNNLSFNRKLKKNTKNELSRFKRFLKCT